MDEYLNNNFIVSFFFLFIIGACMSILSYVMSKSFKKEDLIPIAENNLKRMYYWRTLVAMYLGIFLMLLALYILYNDINNLKQNYNKVEVVEVRK